MRQRLAGLFDMTSDLPSSKSETHVRNCYASISTASGWPSNFLCSAQCTTVAKILKTNKPPWQEVSILALVLMYCSARKDYSLANKMHRIILVQYCVLADWIWIYDFSDMRFTILTSIRRFYLRKVSPITAPRYISDNTSCPSSVGSNDLCYHCMYKYKTQ